jgi:hypothetical protein
MDTLVLTDLDEMEACHARIIGTLRALAPERRQTGKRKRSSGCARKPVEIAAEDGERIQNTDKLAFTIQEAIMVSSLGQTSIYKAINDKRLIARKWGTRTIIRRADLEAFLESLPLA